VHGRPTELAVAALLALAFVPALLSLSRVWGSVPYYSHGYLVPVVAGLLAWRAWPRVAAEPVSRRPLGLVLLAGSLALYGLGAAAGQAAPQGLALVAAVASTLLWLRGGAWLRALAFPVAYLLFMVPLPPSWLQPVIVRLQLFVSAAAVALLRAGGLAVERDGNVLTLPGGESLFVAEACSGVTSLVTLLPLAVLVAWLSLRDPWSRLVVVLFVVPIALLFNLVRVVATALASERFGADWATSASVHEGAGLAVYVVGCLALLGVVAVVRRVRPA